MSALDWCSQVIGPIFTNVITSFPLDEVSTLQPFANSIVTTRMGPAQQLQLSDLRTDCPIATTHPPSNHNVLDPEDPGCNPVLQWKIELLQVGGIDWSGCGRYYGGKLGIFDPPVPVAPCTLEDCGNAGASPFTTAVLVTTPLPDDSSASSTTASPSPILTPGPSSTLVTSPPSDTTPLQSPTSLPSDPVSTPIVVNSSTPSQPTTPKTRSTPIIGATPPTSAGISFAGSSNVVIESQTTVVGTTPATLSGGGVTSLAPSGGGVVLSNSGIVPTYVVPSQAATPAQSLGVVAAQTISGAAVGSSQILVGSQTLNVGGAVATLAGNQIASLGSQGLVIQAPSGVVTTYSIPSSTPAIIGITAGQSVSGVVLGSSETVVGTQTLTVDGSDVTLAGNQVASLGFSGLVVQAPGGLLRRFPSSRDLQHTPLCLRPQ